jgi:leucyl aminopeptidase
MFSNDDEAADALIAASKAQADPLWRMPLWAPYMELLDSDIADMTNSGGAFAGAVTAALFMQKFVPDDVPWVHLDTFAWRPTNKPGRPKGGEALGLRAVFGYLADKYPAR